jgi:hypothetical protein
MIATTTAYCIALFPAFQIGVPVGIMAQALAGGELGADGLPLLMGGVFAGLAGVAGYAAVLVRPNQPAADEPPASPEQDQLTHHQ